jgi:hypothetical protein
MRKDERLLGPTVLELAERFGHKAGGIDDPEEVAAKNRASVIAPPATVVPAHLELNVIHLPLTFDWAPGSGAKMIGRGYFGMTAEHPTKLGRIYSKNIMQREVLHIMGGPTLFGTLNHSDNSPTGLSLEDVSHQITEVYLDDNWNLRGRLEILDTDNGRRIRECILAGVQFEVMPVGWGSTRGVDGEELVQEDYYLERFDLVQMEGK